MKTKTRNGTNLDDGNSELQDDLAVAPQPTDSANIDSIGNDLIDAMPEVQDHAIEQSAIESESNLAKYSHLVDKNGASFDPNIHKTKRDGSPSISKTNKLMLKPVSQRKSTTKAGAKEDKQVACQELTENERLQCVALGKISAGALFGLSRAIGGDEWKPTVDGGYNEAEAIESAFADYYIASGKTEISPKLALTIAIASYAAPRFTKPVTQQRTAGFFKKVHGWWHNRKGKKAEQARQKAEETRKSSEKKEAHTFEA